MTKTKSKLEEVVGEFASVFNESVVSLTVEGTTFISTGLAEVIGPLYDCDQGYVFVRNICGKSFFTHIFICFAVIVQRCTRNIV